MTTDQSTANSTLDVDHCERLLSPTEEFWCDHQAYLRTHRLGLRSRYQPHWTPSWQSADVDPRDCDDGPPRSALCDTMDATDAAYAVSDPNSMVNLKRVDVCLHLEQVRIVEHLNSPVLRNEAENHCVNLVRDTLYPTGDTAILVTPVLREYNDPPFRTVGGVVRFLSQALEGLEFMHDHRVACRCPAMEIMMDPVPLFPTMFRPNVPSRSRDLSGPASYTNRRSHPPRYFFTDFSHSRLYPQDGARQAGPILPGVDQQPPEFRNGKPNSNLHDPFPTDVYYLGRKIEQEILWVCAGFSGFEWIAPLVRDMMDEDPGRRPTMDQAAVMFRGICSKLPLSDLRSGLIRRDGTSFLSVVTRMSLKLGHILRGFEPSQDPAIPNTAIPAPTAYASEITSSSMIVGDAEVDLSDSDDVTMPRWENIVLNSAESTAQKLEMLQVILDEEEQTMSKRRHSDVLRSFLRLSREFKTLPPSYYLKGVELESDARGPAGSGGFAYVYKASWNGDQVAPKVLRTHAIDAGQARNDQLFTVFLREIAIWRQLRHPSIEPLLGVDCETFGPSLATVSKWEHDGNINEAIRSMDDRGESVPHNPWILQIAEGLKYLHDKRIVHGDVRGANILIDDLGHARLTDFGLALLADAHTQTLGPHAGLAVRWTAPERFDEEFKHPTSACDTYAFACTCVEIYSRQCPFNDVRNGHHIIRRVCKGVRPRRPLDGVENSRSMPDPLWDLVEQCWCGNPVVRPLMKDVIRVMKQLVESSQAGGEA